MDVLPNTEQSPNFDDVLHGIALHGYGAGKGPDYQYNDVDPTIRAAKEQDLKNGTLTGGDKRKWSNRAQYGHRSEMGEMMTPGDYGPGASLHISTTRGAMPCSCASNSTSSP